MAALLQDVNERIKALGSDWTKYTVVGSFLLYILGYLALRFHLTALGVGTDLGVLDERYLFTGAKFLVFLVASVPIVVLLALPVAAVLYLLRQLLPERIAQPAWAWWTQPARVGLTGIIVSVLLIQLVMRKCFFFSNLLLAPQLPQDPAWLVRLLLDNELLAFYFSGLVAGCAISGALLWMLRGAELASLWAVFAKALLTFLVAVQLLLLPINYGILIVDKSLPRVAALGNTPLSDGEQAWLLWEGKDGVTWLVRDRKEKKERRTLVTWQRADVKKTEIIGYDWIFPELFNSTEGPKP